MRWGSPAPLLCFLASAPALKRCASFEMRVWEGGWGFMPWFHSGVQRGRGEGCLLFCPAHPSLLGVPGGSLWKELASGLVSQSPIYSRPSYQPTRRP